MRGTVATKKCWRVVRGAEADFYITLAPVSKKTRPTPRIFQKGSTIYKSKDKSSSSLGISWLKLLESVVGKDYPDRLWREMSQSEVLTGG